MLILAFDTATPVAASALVADGEVLGERWSQAVTLLEDIDALLRQASARPTDLDALAVGIGPGSFTGTRIGLSFARGLALALDIPAAGVSTLAALAAGAPGAVQVVDAKRGEVFVPGEGGAGPRVVPPAELVLDAGSVCIGDGALRYADSLRARGFVVPPADDERHRVRARFHVSLAHDFGSADELEPLYVRVPDADRTLV